MGHGNSPSPEDRQRNMVQQPVVEWLNNRDAGTFTLGEISDDLDLPRSSISSTLYRLVRGGAVPGLSIPMRGLYRWDPPASPKPKTTSAALEARVSATETQTKAPTRKRKFTEVGTVGSTAVVIVDGDGQLWRAEKLK